MHRFRFRFRFSVLTLAALAFAVGQTHEAFGQVYGGVYVSPGRHHSTFYAGTYFPGAYGVGSYYGSPYGYGGGYGNGFGTYGTAYGLGYPYGTGYSYSTGPMYSAGNSYATGTTITTYNQPGTAYYGIGNLGTGATYGQLGYGYGNPAVLTPSPAYGTSTTIIRSGPTGGVMQYNAKGNGYTYVPDSTYPTVIQTQPTLGLSRTYVPPSANPVVIESRPQGTMAGLNSPSTSNAGSIKLALPKSAPGPLTYSLNGHLYTIQPGYSQTFRDDRAWTIEFKRDSASTIAVQQPLKAGTYFFAVGASGWELQSAGNAASSDLPPSPLISPIASPQPGSRTTVPPLTTPPLNDASLPPTPLPPP